jgi:MarR family transcriptional regulator, organic hydroperoxide resistance regulator
MAPKSLQTNIIFLCGDFAHMFQRTLSLLFRAGRIPVTIEQFAVLAILFYQNGISQQELATLLGRDKTTIARIITNMIRNKLIQRVNDKADGRRKLIYLTAKGKTIQKKAVKISGELYVKTLADVDEKQLSQGVSLMTRLINNISKEPSKIKRV